MDTLDLDYFVDRFINYLIRNRYYILKSMDTGFQIDYAKSRDIVKDSLQNMQHEYKIERR